MGVLMAGVKGQKRASRVLRDMRWVYDHPKEEPDTPGRGLCRRLLDKDPERFLARLTQLESGHQAAKGAGRASGEKEGERGKDEGEGRLLELIDRLLEDCQP